MATKQQWPADKVERRPIAKLLPYARNPRTHSPAQVEQIAKSITEFGWTFPVLIDEKGNIIAGHGRVMAAESLGLTDVPVMVARKWTDAQKRAYTIADNQLALNAGWNEELLRLELGELQLVNFDIKLIGFDPKDLVSFIAGGSLGGSEDKERGTLLELVNITLDEPTHKVIRGEHYTLSGRHHLLIAGVIAEWKAWAHLLKDDALFCPYPGVFVPFSNRAEKHPLVLVQPDTYIAGHILDRYVEVHGKKSVKLIEVPAEKYVA